MNQEDREKLMQLLTDLLAVQDEISHKKPTYADITYELIAKRNGIKNDILTFVDELCDEACEDCQ